MADDFIDDAFYWLVWDGKWTVAKQENLYGYAHFWVPGAEDGAVSILELGEIGPCIGKEPGFPDPGDADLLRMIAMNLRGDLAALTRDQLVYKLEMVRDLTMAQLREKADASG